MYVGLAAVNESKIQIPIVIYQALQIAAGSVLTIVFRKWIRPAEEMQEEKRKEVRERESV
jgi:sodium/bile acid cotransporter 7